jgi:hypothetical protein
MRLIRKPDSLRDLGKGGVALHQRKRFVDPLVLDKLVRRDAHRGLEHPREMCGT